MWFRVELNKDGGIASCKQVSGSFESSRHVRYIEADSAKSATAMAAKWWLTNQRMASWHRDKRTELVANGICTDCRKESARRGKGRCAACAGKQLERLKKKRAEKKRGIDVDRRFDHTRTDAEKYSDRSERMRLLKPHYRRRGVARLELRLLQSVQMEFMRKPQSFGAWMAKQISAREQFLRQAVVEQEVPTAAE